MATRLSEDPKGREPLLEEVPPDTNDNIHVPVAVGQLCKTAMDCFINDTQTAYHPVAPCRMGFDSGAGLDAALLVPRPDGLRVVDASVTRRSRDEIPTRSRTITEKAVDLVRGRGALAGWRR